MKRVFIIGSGAECDVVVNDTRVSGRHCQLVQTDRGLQLTDLDSTNGTFVRGIRIAAPISLNLHDEVLAGCAPLPWHVVQHLLQVPPPNAPAARQNSAAAAPKGVSLAAPAKPQHREMIVGRDPECDFVVDMPSISRQHARLPSGIKARSTLSQ